MERPDGSLHDEDFDEEAISTGEAEAGACRIPTSARSACLRRRRSSSRCWTIRPTRSTSADPSGASPRGPRRTCRARRGPSPSSTAASLVNWMSPYSTTCTWLPHGIEEVEAAAGEDLGARLLEGAAGGLHVVHHQPEVAAVVGRLAASLGDRDELIAHVDERHPGHAAAQLELEDLAVELERRVEVADLERDVVDPDEPGAVGHGRRCSRDRHRAVAGASPTSPTGASPPGTLGRMRCERGQATIEWVGLVLLASLALGALAAAVPRGRRPLVRRLPVPPDRVRGQAVGLCDGPAPSRARTGARTPRCCAATRPGIVYEPGERSLPVDFRACRSARLRATRPTTATSTPTAPTPAAAPPCSRAWSAATAAPTSSTGSTTPTRTRPSRARTSCGSTARCERVATYPGYHDDDWEGYQVRIDRDGRVGRALDLPRPLAVVQAGGVPRPLGPAHRLDPRVARQPRRPHPARTAAPGRHPAAGGPSAAAGALPRPHPGREPARAHDHGGGPARWCRWRRSTGAATGAGAGGASRPGEARRTTTRRSAFLSQIRPCAAGPAGKLDRHSPSTAKGRPRRWRGRSASSRTSGVRRSSSRCRSRSTTARS